MGCTQSAPDKGAEGGINNSSQDQIDGQEAAQAAAMVLGSADMSSQVELKFGCRHLPKMDTLRSVVVPVWLGSSSATCIWAPQAG